MFDNLAGKDPEDIFSSTENLPKVAPPIKHGAPLASSAPDASALLASAPAPQVPSAPAAGHRGMPAALKVLLFFIAIAVVVGAAWAIARFLLSSPASQVPEVPAAPEAAAPAPAPVEAPAVIPPSETLAKPVELDTDLDGIMDAQEIQLGTNPNSPDTDGDGLTDREEISAYKTNPLISDTDGDGFADGVEVRNGYNPNGEGKLFQVPSNP